MKKYKSNNKFSAEIKKITIHLLLQAISSRLILGVAIPKSNRKDAFSLVIMNNNRV